MNRFVMGVSEDLQKVCYTVLLHDNIKNSRLMVLAQHVEETRAKMKSRDAKRAKSFDGGASKNRLEIQDKPMF